jgi:molecular chaperone GrpE
MLFRFLKILDNRRLNYYNTLRSPSGGSTMTHQKENEAHEGNKGRSRSHLKKDVRKDAEVIHIPISREPTESIDRRETQKAQSPQEAPETHEEPRENFRASVPSPEHQAARQEEPDLEATIKELKESNLRLLADFENFRRRKEEEVSSARKYASEEIIRQLLGILDNFERALANVESAPSLASFVQGIQMIHKQMLDVLQKEGVMEINARGESFDPSLHQAVAMIEDNELPDETVVEELQKGYRLKDKVIRPSMVRVSKKS